MSDIEDLQERIAGLERNVAAFEETVRRSLGDGTKGNGRTAEREASRSRRPQLGRWVKLVRH